MSQTPNDLSRQSSSGAAASDKPRAKPVRSRAQRWRRRVIWALIIFIGSVVMVRAVVPLLLPTVLRSVASGYGLSADYDRLDFNLLGGDVGLWNLRFTPVDGGEPVLTIDYCRGSVSTFGLLKGKLHVDRAEAEGANVTVERLPDGKIPLLDRLLTSTPTTPSQAPGKPTEIPLEPPLSITALRLQGARARLVDRMVSPTTDVRLFLNLILNDIGSPTAPTRFSIQLSSPELLGALYVDGHATARNKLVNADLSVRMFGLNPQPARAYLAAFGLAPIASDIGATAAGKLTMTPSGYSTTRPSEQPITSVAIKLDLEDISLSADSRIVAAVKKISLDAPIAAPGELRVASVLIDGVRASAWRDAQGRPGFAGIALGAESTTIVANPAPATQPSPTAPLAVDSPAHGALPIVELQSLRVSDVKLDVTDDFISPSTQLSLNVEQVALAKISTDPAHADIPAIIGARASAPGLARSIQLTGDLAAAKPVKTLHLKLRIDGIDGSAIDPYLAPLGVSRALNDAQFNCDLSASVEPAQDGSIGLGLKLSDLKLFDADQEWFGFPKVEVADARIAPDASRVRLGNIAVQGPALGIKRHRDGSITALGFTLDPNKIAASPDQQKTPATAPATNTLPTARPTTEPLRLPVVEIGTLTWNGVSIALDDQASLPPVSASLKDVDVRLSDLIFDPKAARAKPGTLKVSLGAPGSIEKFAMDGTLAPTGEAIGFDLRGQASGVSLAGLKPLLNSLGLDPILKSGTLSFRASGDVRQTDQGVLAGAGVKELLLADGKTEWIKIDEASVKGASFDGTSLGIESVRIDRPALRVERDSSGRLAAAGIRLIPAVGGPPTPPVDPTAPPVPSRVELSLPIVARLSNLQLSDARIDFIDHAVAPAVQLAPRASVKLSNVVVGQDAEPAKLDAALAIPGVIESLKITGTMQTAPTKQGVDLTIAGSGISGKSLQPYLPPGISASTDSGTLSAKFSAQIAHNPAGGSSVNVSAREVSFDDQLQPTPAIRLSSARLAVDRFDLPNQIVAIKEISTDGFAVRVFENDSGLVLPGLIVGTAPTQSAAPPKPAPPATQAAAAPGAEVGKLVAGAKVKTPRVTLEQLSIGADRLSVQTRAMAYPLSLNQLSLTGQNIDLLGDDPTQRPPFDLKLSANVDRLVDSIRLDANLAPFAAEPRASAKLDVTGIRATELITLLPDLAKQIDGKDLSDGRFTSEIEAQFTFTRRGILGIDPTRDIGATFSVKNTQLTQAGAEKPLAGVEEIRGEKAQFSPASGSLAIKSLDIVKPQARIVRDADGIHALGLMLKMPAPSQPASQPAAQPDEPAAQPAKPTPAPEAVAQQSSELTEPADVRIDSFTISGIDLVLEDRVGKPVTILPIAELDAEFKGLNTRALREPLPIKFNVLAGAGKVALTREDGTQTEPREVFAQFVAGGSLTAYPKPNGWIKSSLSAFDLTAARGIADQVGIKLGGGTFDFATDVRMEGTDDFSAKLYPTLNDLRLKDSPDGKVQRFLNLGVPLDLAIVAVEDADGAISLPVTAPMKAGQLQVGSIIASAAGAVGAQVMKAVASAPLKVAALVGLNVSKEKDLSPITIAFAPGESLLTTSQQQQIDQLIVRMKSDETLTVALVHTPGSGDLVTSALRANPSANDADELAAQFRRQKFDLQRRRAELAGTLRVALASQNRLLADQTLEQLQQVSSDLMNTEDSLDDLLGLLRPGAQRQADRRTKSAAIGLGQYRLDTVKARFDAASIPDAAGRISVARPSPKIPEGQSEGQITLVLNRRAKQ